MTIPEIAGAIRARRIALRLTQTELSDLSGVSPRFLHDLEQGKTTVRLESVAAVCTALGLDLLVTPRSVR